MQEYFNPQKLLKNKKALAVIFLLVMLVAVAYPLGTINPGFEGAKCNFYGAYFNWDGWDGEDTLHRYQDAEDPLLYKPEHNFLGQLVGEENVYWSSYATPNDAGLGSRQWKYPLTPHVWEKPHLKVHVESNVQLQHITKQGDPDPLNWSESNPLEGRRIEYWSKKAVKTTETEDTVTYEYELTKESFLICPAEFWVGFYLVPSQDEAGTGSGWREGEWSDITVWFRLDFHVWDNAYYDDWMKDPETEVYTTEYGGTVTSQKKLIDPDGYRGGFPISGWIQGWEKAGLTSDIPSGEQQSPIWYDVKGTETGIYTDDQLHKLRDILMSKVEFSPGMVGQFISLYDAPEVQFSYEPSNTNYQPDSLANSVKTPDSAMKKDMYFPINVENFGTYAQEQGFLSGWKVYYPSCYFRIRMIYGVYGTFKYLWTEQVTKDVVINYPNTTERHGTTVIHTSGPLTPFNEFFSGIGDWFTNPFNQLWTFFIIMIIIILAVTILNPGMWGTLALTYKATRKSRKSSRRKPRGKKKT